MKDQPFAALDETHDAVRFAWVQDREAPLM
jgi:hypothetical protein